MNIILFHYILNTVMFQITFGNVKITFDGMDLLLDVMNTINLLSNDKS